MKRRYFHRIDGFLSIYKFISLFGGDWDCVVLFVELDYNLVETEGGVWLAYYLMLASRCSLIYLKPDLKSAERLKRERNKRVV